jgi:hypothetical protein
VLGTPIGEITHKADRLVREYGTRNADKLAEELGIVVIERPFKRQKGIYTVIERNRFVFLKSDLHPVQRSIVLLHEIGHDQNHREVLEYASQGFDICQIAQALHSDINLVALKAAELRNRGYQMRMQEWRSDFLR